MHIAISGTVAGAFAEAAENNPRIESQVLSKELIPKKALITAPALSERIAQLILKIVETSRASPLFNELDQRDLRVALKRILAALKFRTYQQWDSHGINDEIACWVFRLGVNANIAARSKLQSRNLTRQEKS